MIAEINSYETQFLRMEIEEKNVYFRHGIDLKPGSVVVDAGANIGIFSLHVLNTCSQAQIHAIEPSPLAYACLQKNLHRFGSAAHTYPFGLGEKSGVARFTECRGYSVLSGFHFNADADAKVIESGISAQGKAIDAETSAEVRRRVNDAKEIQTQVLSISDLLREAGITKIDLLKLDVEGSEIAVFRGLDNADWPKIRQIVVEAHSVENSDWINATLRNRGFRVIEEDDEILAGTNIRTLYALRAE